PAKYIASDHCSRVQSDRSPAKRLAMALLAAVHAGSPFAARGSLSSPLSVGASSSSSLSSGITTGMYSGGMAVSASSWIRDSTPPDSMRYVSSHRMPCITDESLPMVGTLYVGTPSSVPTRLGNMEEDQAD